MLYVGLVVDGDEYKKDKVGGEGLQPNWSKTAPGQPTSKHSSVLPDTD